jgi:hypothetical protein
MTQAVETTRALVVAVGPEGATVAYNGRNVPVSWAELRAAARQDDPELRRVYGALLAEAERRASYGPVIVSVEDDGTNVWYVCRVRAAWGGGPAALPDGRRLMHADEGMSGPYSCAAFDARNVARRLGKRVARLAL